MEKTKKLKLDEVQIMDRLSKGQMKNLYGRDVLQKVDDKLLACGGVPTHCACNVCQA